MAKRCKRWVIVFLLTVGILFLLSGFPFWNKGWQIREVDGKYYVEFAEPLPDLGFCINTIAGFAHVKFLNLASMQNGFFDGTLSERQIRSYREGWIPTEYGYPICDLRNLYEPEVPSDVHLYTEVCLWEGVTYQFTAEWGEYKGKITFSLRDMPDRHSWIREYEEQAEEQGALHEKLFRAGQEMDVYRYFQDGKADYEQYRYTLACGEDERYIEEQYRFDEAGDRYLHKLSESAGGVFSADSCG